MAIDNSTQDGPLIRKCLDVINFITKIIPKSALGLFCLLTKCLSQHLKAVFTGIKEITAELKNCTPSPSVLLSISKRLLILKEQHFLIYKAIRLLSQYFGFYLLIEVIYIFTGVTNSSMFILLGTMSGDRILTICTGVIFLDFLVHLFMITSSSEQVISDVKLFISLILRMRLTNCKFTD